MALGGCGGAMPATPNFSAVANTICTNADDEIVGLPAERRSLVSFAHEAQLELPIVRTELKQLTVLTAPASKAPEFASALASTRRELELVARLIAAVRAQNAARIATVALAADEADGQAKTAMTSLGLGACAREAVPRGAR
ncbi:MAG TPA: hypothetical protein VHM72_04220 [Solirubrobacteraceae bacterium]|nr:hypothetical protein [Solirubrobacteraceae bacterium]